MASRCTVVFTVDDLAGSMATIKAQGAAVVNEPFTVGSFQVAYLADPEGNVFGIRQA
jgi:predicted enzyme related to lactoylglutathione lyase